SMYSSIRNILQIRGMKLSFEILLIVFVFFAVKTYMQRDLVTGTPPSLSGTLLNGQTFDLATYRGKPLLLHFWATWCSICKLEENNIAELSKNFQVLTVAMNSGTAKGIEQYLHKQAISFPVIIDADGLIAKRFGVTVVPTSFILDASGVIRFTEVGFTTDWGLKSRLWLAQD
ncbi:MAG: protein disulfide oxidoreductase, partial [Thiohalomonadales bacterium]